MTERMHRIAELAQHTGMSLRYWQKRCQDGNIDGAKLRRCGKRIIYLIPESVFRDLCNLGLLSGYLSAWSAAPRRERVLLPVIFRLRLVSPLHQALLTAAIISQRLIKRDLLRFGRQRF